MDEPATGEPSVFLFTDIEGSTRLWERVPEAMASALALHDALLTTAIEAAGGRVFKSVGDAICAVCPDADSALRTAVEGQRALSAEDWQATGLDAPLRVRMAIQSGQADAIGDDFAGPVLNRLSRLLRAGHGGQILLTGDVADEVSSSLPAGVALRDLGDRRLRDVPGRVRIVQVVVDGLAAAFPPLDTLEVIEHNLPVPTDPFIGRDEERARLHAMLGSTQGRLVTLLGPGGIGKTRLATESARAVVDDFPDGIWFVDLTSLRGDDSPGGAVMRVLGLRETPGATDDETVLGWLREREALLLLDNCEQIIESVAHFVAALLRSSPHVRILATSRIPLEIRGEQRLPIEPLPLPDKRAGGDVGALQEIPSVQLFVSRAMSIQPSFSLDTANAPDIAAICRQVEGIPLALELAAARITVLTPSELTNRLGRQLTTLSSKSRALPGRHQTLRNAIQWSYDLLPVDEQRVLLELSVFAGGWTAESMGAILGLEGHEALRLLQSLIAQSLVRTQTLPDGASRYSMLESIREFTAEQFEEATSGRVVREAHAAYYTGLVERAAPSLLGGEEQIPWMSRIDDDLDNIRFAASWWLDTRNTESALSLCTNIWNYWSIRGAPSEGRRWLEQALELAGEPDSHLRASALRKLGNLSIDLGDTRTAQSLYEESLRIEQASNHRLGIAESLSNLGMVAGMQGRFDDEFRLLTESYAIWLELRSLRGQCVTLLNLGIQARDAGDSGRSHRHFGDASALAGQMSDLLAGAWIDLYHARLDRDEGRVDVARLRLEKSKAIFDEAGDTGGIGHVQNEQGRLFLLEDDFVAAERSFRNGMETHRQRGDKPAIAESLEGLAQALAGRGAGRDSAQSLAEAKRLRAEAGWPVQRAERASLDRLEEALRESLGERAFERMLGSQDESFLMEPSPVH